MVVVFWKVFGSWIVTPSSLGWNTVVYSAWENLLTLPRFHLSPGTTIASFALLDSFGMGSCALVVAFRIVLSGR